VKLLVTGAGRTGTWWLTHALRACGVDATHERAFSTTTHGEGEWQAEVSWLAAPYTPRSDCHVVHLVRHPLEAIRSRAAWGSFERSEPFGPYDPRIKGRWALTHVPEIADGATAVERAAIHWARWNDLVTADELLRIEDVDSAEVLRLARIVDPDAQPGPMPAKTINTARRPAPNIGWGDVAHIPGLIDQAQAWRYRCD
jgi:hypothetical protein